MIGTIKVFIVIEFSLKHSKDLQFNLQWLL